MSSRIIAGFWVENKMVIQAAKSSTNEKKLTRLERDDDQRSREETGSIYKPQIIRNVYIGKGEIS